MLERSCASVIRTALSAVPMQCLVLLASLIIVGAATPLAQGAEVQHVYDKAGRLIQTVAPDGSNVQYTYDAVGNILSTKKNAAGTLTLSSFTPDRGVTGTVVTLYGSGFDVTAAKNTVKFNGAAATISKATATTLTVAVPAAATSGPISVTNNKGTVTSIASFLVGNTLAPGDVPKAITLAANGSMSFKFTGQAGQGYALGLTGVSMAGGSLTITVTNPDNSDLVACSSITGTTSCVLPYLPATGIYTVTFTAESSAVTFSAQLNADIGGELVANAPGILFVADKVGQAATYTLKAAVGDIGRLFITGASIPGHTQILLFKKDGTFVLSGGVYGNVGAGGLATVPLSDLEAGDYRVRLLPPLGNATGRMLVTLLQDKRGTLTAGDSTSQTVSLLAQQQVSYTFTGAAGQWLGLGMTEFTTVPSNELVRVNVFLPDGGYLDGFWASSETGAASFALPQLPVNGAYRVVIEPGNNAANFKLLLTTDASGALVANSPLTFAPTRMGQAAAYTFSGTAGQSANLVITGNTFAGHTYVYVYAPDGSHLSGSSVYHQEGYDPGPLTLTLSNLSVSGNYTVRLIPPSGQLGSLTLTLRAEAAGVLPIDSSGTGIPVSLQANQNGGYTFTGTAGQWLGLGMTEFATVPGNESVRVNVYKPGGEYMDGFTASSETGAAGFALPQLPVSGAYRVVIEPGNNAANFKLLLTADASGALAANTSQTFTPTRVGQAASYTFNGTAGQNVNLAMVGSTFAGFAYIYVYAPDGSYVNSGYVHYQEGYDPGASTLTLSNLPVSGNYTVRLVPPSGQLGNMTITLRTETTGALPIGSAGASVSLQANQNGSYTFTGTTGQWLGLGMSEFTTALGNGSVRVDVYQPSGDYLDGFWASSETGAAGFALPRLPMNGTYRVVVQPGNNKADFKLLLTADASGALAANTARTFAPTRVGQAATYTFSGTAGQNVNLAMMGSTFAGYTYAYVYAPDGSYVNSAYVVYYQDGYDSGSAKLTLSNLPATGTYVVRLMPPSGQLGSIAITLQVEATGALPIGDSGALVSLQANQNGGYTFTGVAGQWLGLGLSELATVPGNGSLRVDVYKPNGEYLDGIWASSETGAAGFALPQLPVSGAYRVVIEPGNNAATFKLLLTADASGALAANTTRTFAPTRVGQAASYTFTATAGQTVGLSMSGSTFTGYTYIYVYAPDGSYLNSGYVYCQDGNTWATDLALVNVPSTGTYVVRVMPPSGQLGKVTVSVSGKEALTAGATAKNVSLTGVGGFSFVGSVGQRLGIGLADLVVTPSDGSLGIVVYAPDGTLLVSCPVSGTSGGCTLPELPTTGLYQILIQPGNNTANFKLLLTVDASGTLAANGARTFAPTRVGQAASYTFTATAGQTVGMSISGSTFPGYTYVYVYAPDGSYLSSSYVYCQDGNTWATDWVLVNVPATGTYVARVLPPSGQLGKVTVGVSGKETLTTGAAAKAVSLSGAGGFSFTGSAGQRLGIGLADLVVTPSDGSLSIVVYTPTGDFLVSCSVSGASGGCTLPELPVTGTYQILLQPGNNTANFKLLLTADVSGALVANSPRTFVPTRVGQAASYTFTATAGQTVGLSMSGSTFAGYTYVYVYAPDGSHFSSSYAYYQDGYEQGGAADWTLDISSTGTYVVRVMPPSGSLGTVTLKLQ